MEFAYIALGIGVMAIVIPMILLFIKRSPQAKGVQPYGAEEATDAAAQQTDTSNQGISMKIARKSTAFYALVVFFFLITSVASFSMHIPQFLVDKGFDASAAGSIMGIYMVGVLIGSLAIGVLTDKIGSRVTAILAMGAGIIATVLLMTVSSSTAILTFAVGLLGIISSSIGTLGPAIASSLFGNKDYSEIYSTASMGLAISSIVAIPAYGFIYDTFKNYDIALYLIIAMLVINIFAVLIAFKDKNKLVKEGHWN